MQGPLLVERGDLQEVAAAKQAAAVQAVLQAVHRALLMAPEELPLSPRLWAPRLPVAHLQPRFLAQPVLQAPLRATAAATASSSGRAAGAAAA